MAEQETESRGFWGTIKDMSHGISSADRARIEKSKNLAIRKQELEIANMNAKVTKNAQTEYGAVQELLLQKQDKMKQDIALAKGDSTQYNIIMDDYNDEVNMYNERLAKQKKRIARQYKKSGVYDFKETDDDNYKMYLEGRDELDEGKPLTKGQWIERKTLENMKSEGLFDFKEFGTATMATSGEGKETSYQLKFSDGNIDDLGTVEQSLKIFAGRNKSEEIATQAGKSKVTTKTEEIKGLVKFYKGYKDELGLSETEYKNLLKSTVGLSTENTNKISKFKEDLKATMPDLNSKQMNSLVMGYAQKLAGMSDGAEKELFQLQDKRDAIYAQAKDGVLTEAQQQKVKEINDRVTKISQPSMNSLKISLNTLKELKTGVTKNFEAKYPNMNRDADGNIDITRINMKNLTGDEKAQLKTYVDAKRKALNPAGFEYAVKKTAETTESLGLLSTSLDGLMTSINRGDNVNVINQWYKDNIGSYVGLTDKQLQDTQLKSSIAGAFNMIKHSLFGATQSAGEMRSFNQMVGNLYGTNKRLVVGIETLLKNSISKIEANKAVMGDEAFNVTFGERLGDLKAMQQTAQSFIESKSSNKKNVEIKQATSAYRATVNGSKETPKKANSYLDLDISKY